jgi:histone-lysine N-methyltransferase SETMAR
VAAVQQLVNDDPHVTYEMIEDILDIGSPAVMEILHERLGLRKVCARWVPHMLSEDQKRQRVKFCEDNLRKYFKGVHRSVFDILTGDETWLYHYDPKTKRQSQVWLPKGAPRETKVRRPRSVGKKMFAIFFMKAGFVSAVPLDDKKTVTGMWYSHTCLPQVFETVKSRRPKTGLRGLVLHHDNAPAHRAGVTLEYLEGLHVKLMEHPPYSPDLSPCDFWLFPKLKEPLRGKDFSSDEDLQGAMYEVLDTFELDDWHTCFDNWFTRMQRCIDAKGEYFEKQ